MPVQENSISSLMRYLLISFIICLFFYFGRTLLIPLFYGLFIAIVLYPMCKWLESHRVPRSLGITIGLIIIVLLFAGLMTILFFELNSLRKDLPGLEAKVQPAWVSLQQWLLDNIGITFNSQEQFKENISGAFTDNIGAILSGTLNRTANGLFMLFIIPVFSALFLYNREDFVKALQKMVGDKYHAQLQDILGNTIHTYFHFIKGMIMVYVIVGILNTFGLMALGIEHAALFGFVTAIMTIIPYAGIFISALLPITVAWITKDSIWYPLGVVAVFAFVQYLEANVIFPKVVATQLNVSTWATLVAIIAGGILWGVSGMILFIPFVGMFKIISDHIPEWEGLNILLSRTRKKK